MLDPTVQRWYNVYTESGDTTLDLLEFRVWILDYKKSAEESLSRARRGSDPAFLLQMETVNAVINHVSETLEKVH